MVRSLKRTLRVLVAFAAESATQAQVHAEVFAESTKQSSTLSTTRKERCTRVDNPRYDRYGGRGIEFRFRSFEEFFNHIGSRPSEEHQLDRIENDGHYEIGNVRWVTGEINQRNRGDNRLITYKGRTQSLAAWSEELKIPWGRLRHRLDRGWSVEDSFERPVSLRHQKNAQAGKRPTSR